MATSGRVVLGGTFDHLHAGHEALLNTAFAAGRPVAIGLTTEEYLADHPKPGAGRLQPYTVRRRRLARWLSARYPRRRWTIVPISDAFGGSVEDGVAALVVSADTIAGGRAVNAERKRRGRRPVPIRVVPLVLGDDLVPISSRRIRAGTIDREGRRVSPIGVGVSADDPRDRSSAVRGVRRAFPRARIVTPGARPAELLVTIHRGRAGTGSVAVARAEVRLPSVSVDARTPASLALALERLLRRSRQTNRLSAARR